MKIESLTYRQHLGKNREWKIENYRLNDNFNLIVGKIR